METRQARGVIESLQLHAMCLLKLIYRQAEHLSPGSLTCNTCKLCVWCSWPFVQVITPGIPIKTSPKLCTWCSCYSYR